MCKERHSIRKGLGGGTNGQKKSVFLSRGGGGKKKTNRRAVRKGGRTGKQKTPSMKHILHTRRKNGLELSSFAYGQEASGEGGHATLWSDA